MAFKRKVKLPGVTGLDGETANQELPIGARYHLIEQLISDTAGDPASDIVNKIRIIVNGVPQREITMDELISLNTLHGDEFGEIAAGTAAVGNPGYVGIVPILYGELFRKEVFYQEFLAWGTGGLSSFAIEYDLAGAAGTSIVNRAVVDQSLIAIKGQTVQQTLGNIMKWYRREIEINGTTKNIVNLPLIRGDYSQISLFDGDITHVQVKLNDVIVHDLTKQENDAVLTRAGMFPVDSRYDLVFDYEDIIDSVLPASQFNGLPVSSLEVIVTLSDGTPRNIPIVFQTFGRPD